MFTKPLFGFNPTSKMLVLIAKDNNGKLFKLRWNYVYSDDPKHMIKVCRDNGHVPLYMYRITPKFSEARLAA